ncbi:calcium-binding protein [Pseudodonghicola xiamenensis]|uniref:Hemolysin-type calcium-binding repeat-containing protein n=1 Tax=Pseudodonghicola xiamenensis TaxID=337702 RepID=A0A8J3H2J1_9RHOB|nr:hypothetical protein [Pseudodonghicola xiamenensis]GHG79895.1 hypothetical protein GCM10010961_02420 [Pseudodonghicola xiamenensis]
MMSLGSLAVTDVLEGYAPLSALKARNAGVAEVDGRTLVYLGGYTDGTTPVFELGADGRLAALAGSEGEGLDANGISSAITVKGKPFLLVAEPSSHWVISYRIVKSGDNQGSLRYADLLGNIDGYDFEHVDEVVPFKTGGTQYFAVTGSTSMSVFSVGPYGDMSFQASVDASEIPALDGVVGVAVTQVDGQTIAIAGWAEAVGAWDHVGGVSSFIVGEDGTLAEAETLALPGVGYPADIVAVEAGGTSFAIFHMAESDLLRVYALDAEGHMTEQSSYDLFASDGLTDLADLKATELDGVPVLVASAPGQDTLAIYGVAADGSLVLLQKLVDAVALDEIDDLSLANVDGHYFVLADGAGFYDIAVTTVEIAGGDDVVKGTARADTLLGLAGADQLVGLGGNDWLLGGIGDDLLKGGNGADWLEGSAGDDRLIGGKGSDRLEGGVGGDLLRGDGGVDTVSYAGSGAAVAVNLRAGTATGGDATGDRLLSIENLVGTGFADKLTGSNKANLLDGGDRKDVLKGLGGDDLLLGGNGNDRLEGSRGDDILDGGDGDDVLLGGAGNDRIIGGPGFDVAKGGAGDDIFVFDDRSLYLKIKDFTPGEDRIDLSGLSALDSFDAVLDRLEDTTDGASILAGGQMIMLSGVPLAELGAEDFLF